MHNVNDRWASLDIERISLKPRTQPLEIAVNYPGLPALGYGETKQIELVCTNQTKSGKIGKLLLHTKNDVSISPKTTWLEMQPEETVTVPVQVALSEACVHIPGALTIAVEIELLGGEVVRDAIGLAGAQSYYAIGPFWDIYDTTLYERSPWYDPLTHQLKRPEGAANFNNYVHLDQPYIDETSFVSLPTGRRFNAPEHKLPVDEWFGVQGPACWYLIQDIASPDEREVRLIIGNNDAFQIWLNDEPVARVDQQWFWMRYNHDFPVRLRQGTNRPVIKLLRRGDTCHFSLGIAHPKTHVRWVSDLSFPKIFKATVYSGSSVP